MPCDQGAWLESADQGMDFRAGRRAQGDRVGAEGRGARPPGNHSGSHCGSGPDADRLFRPHHDFVGALAARVTRMDVSAGLSDLRDVSTDGRLVPQGAGFPQVR